ncbi:PREDICTED: uncharacterized protein LOC105969832 [Erythranthe guttata]|uniref:uncharacterized protein LOC105969832 n=1 Tax=Erythranthe guttata TaxID=4155 RepID=UPI00064D86F6|nr:PREDICTED: uncharacterized protein LOC105969832 [Erythranthe guttata]|eukprot:XP_012850062.1 PREDICTED: uncharacterized protein LOC105969832 [Erythranthe guttata]
MRNRGMPTRTRNNMQFRYNLRARVPDQVKKMRKLFGLSDTICHDNLRMNRDTFNRLCYIFENVGGIRATRNVLVPEQVAIFLHVLGHHSIHFNNVLEAVLMLHSILLVTPKPGCLGALDGTYIEVRVPKIDKPRYRNRKGDISVNVLAVCDHSMNFIYVLSDWESSAADSRILHDGVARPNGLRVPNGKYYLVHGGYTNENEFFNMKHAKARKAVEMEFGILKSRWGILRSPEYYPIKAQNRIIMACCLIDNFIRANVDVDPERQMSLSLILMDPSHHLHNLLMLWLVLKLGLIGEMLL